MEEIEQYFTYRWKNDKNSAIQDQQDIDLLEQLPNHIQDKLLSYFLFKGFLNKFQGYFRIVNSIKPGIMNSYYTWNDEPYCEFMACLLRNLEPCQYP